MKVLVVEDDVTTRLLLSGTLRKWGYEVTTCADGEDAWEEVKKRETRLVITDWEMPRLDGAGLCKRIRTQLGSTYVYVLLLTNYKDADHIVQGLSAGADDFISKPFNPLELQARMAVGQRILLLQDDLVEKHRELERLNQQLARIAATDALTQLGNRRSFDEALARAHSLALRHGRAYGVLMADLDHFKSINDRFGHAIGDKVLAEVSAAFRNATRSEDELFRYGGEEIVILTREQTTAGLTSLCDRLTTAAAAVRITSADHVPVAITVSVGAALYDGRERVEGTLLVGRADDALYRAKHAGRNRFVLWDGPAAP